MPKKYLVRLTDGARETLHQILQKRGVAAQRVRRASMVLKAEVDGPSWAEATIADACGCRTQTVETMRESLVTEGCERTRHGNPKRRVRSKGLDGEHEAKIIALRLGQPPKGWANGTLRRLAAPAVTLEIVASVRHETRRRTRKKTR
jgi:hypothetical protein